MKIPTLFKTLVFVLLLVSPRLVAQGSDLIISEYIEGKNNNRAIEIYNPTDNPVDLGSYSLKQSYNGLGFGNSADRNNDIRYTLPLTGTLESKEVVVIANGYAVDEIKNVADYTYIFDANVSATTIPGCNVLTYSGNDAIGLFKNDILVDVVGVETEAPNGGWEVAGIEKATQDHVLVRKGDKGNTDWTTSAGTDFDNSEWYVLDFDEFTYLGWHTPSTIGIENNVSGSAGKVKIYPNPAADFITIDLPERAEKISIMNSTGKVIKEIKPATQQQKIDVSGYDSGVYLIKIKKSSGVQTFKVIVL